MSGSNEQVQRYALAVLSHLILVAAWHFFVVIGKVPKIVMPSPYDTLHALSGSELSLARKHRGDQHRNLRWISACRRVRHPDRASVFVVSLP